jgi:2-dehydropantoate 2-reductase
MGSGGLGSLFGGLQARAGLDVTFIARGANLAALRENGLTVELANEQFHTAVKATSNPAEVGKVDVVWFCVKTYDVAEAVRQGLPLIGPETIVIPIQNGVGIAESIGSVLGAEHVVGAVNLSGATLVRPGQVVTKGPFCRVMVGELNGSVSPRLEILQASYSGSGIGIELSPDISKEIWDKFVVACFSLGLGALMRSPLAPILENPESRALALGVLSEAAAVARAEGVDLPAGTPERWIRYAEERVALNPDLAGSMYFDLLQGRRLELEAINGAAVRLGRKHGVPTPLNFAVYAGLLPYVNGRAD